MENLDFENMSLKELLINAFELDRGDGNANKTTKQEKSKRKN